MNNSIQEKKGNPVVTLKAQAEKFDFSRLRADKTNESANTGEQMYEDFRRMRFVINSKNLDQSLIGALIDGAKQYNFDEVWDRYYKNQGIPGNKKTDQYYKEEFERFYNLGKGYAHLLPKEGDENKSYRAFGKEVFKEMFKYAEAQVPSDSILKELVTNCNQAAYVGALYNEDSPLFHVTKIHKLTFSSSHTTYINCSNSERVEVTVKELISATVFVKPNEELCKLNSSLEFALESQDGKDDVIYKDGKLSLTVPRKLRDYKTDGISLFDIIKEYFYKFCEKLGFKFEVEIEHDLGDPMSYLEEVALPIHSNEHENTL
ncbi:MULTISPECIES: hypothetical protein [unclassified Wolbachia]|uniref:hypothetical protein n=1 Tax=unclassified Wolbachia TaxID=2640676 RepID=UPI0022210734|nr:MULTISPECIES: hypothetical protein [unclassified Wolbachia]